ncbi:hypothetical protein H8S17_11915 [Roseburia sp. BX1005]|uniref:MORN repeat protein n=1 Tax=Roseburia zhanii TaxID=2763064 RepID=A0A923RUF6_9FIRM|nr:hypothetical protein [Roseburia zhanii]MBC5714895.1 hypothetical protein [Roseburia zhanii]
MEEQKKFYNEQQKPNHRTTLWIVILIIIVIFLVKAFTNKPMIDAVKEYSAKGKYSVENYPYIDSRASKVINVYKNAMAFDSSKVRQAALENKDHWCLLAQNGILKKNSYKRTNAILDSVYLYYGDLKKGKPHGIGILFKYYGDDTYVVDKMGYFKKGALNGYGIDIDIPAEIMTSTLYEGLDFYNVAASVIYEGEWKKGLYSGQGITYWPCAGTEDDLQEWDIKTVGTKNIAYVGEWKKGVMSGEGKMYYPTGQLLYSGQIKKGKASGTGKQYYPNGNLKYAGKFKKGEMHGKGTLFNEDGSLNYKGKFKRGNIY